MASAVYAALAIILIGGGAALAVNLGRAAERVVSVLTRGAEDVQSRVQRWRVLGMTYIVAGALLLVISLLSR
jgi:hypothetical protein